MSGSDFGSFFQLLQSASHASGQGPPQFDGGITALASFGLGGAVRNPSIESRFVFTLS